MNEPCRVAEGMVFDIQHFAVHDGPGIRTLVFLKGCPLSCPWCCNPESRAFHSELRHSSSRCRVCRACAKACPEKAVLVGMEGPAFDRAPCIACDGWPCVEACPQDALSKVGRTMTVPEVMARIEADRAFYENSGGGVTFSGGEPLAQPDFLEALLTACRAAGISTAVETCGYALPDVVERMEPLVDLFLYDLKILDPERHEEITGCPNHPILRNLRWLAEHSPGKVTVRVPVVPNYTDFAENLEGIAALVSGLGLPRLELEPFHALGMDKHDAFGIPCAMAAGLAPPDSADLRAWATRLSTSQMACTVSGG